MKSWTVQWKAMKYLAKVNTKKYRIKYYRLSNAPVLEEKVSDRFGSSYWKTFWTLDNCRRLK